MKQLTDIQIRLFNSISNEAKADILKMTTIARSGHPGGAISSFDIFLISFAFSNIFENYKNMYDIYNSEQEWEKMKENISFSNKEDTDKFFISNGHVSSGWYALLSAYGIVDKDTCNAGFRKINSPFTGHVEQTMPFISWDTGSLGQGLSAACGKALYYKKNNFKSNIWVYMGDGEQQKGQIAEARRFIKKYKLSNINIIIDNNGLQVNGNVQEVMPANLKAEYEACGFYVEEIDGHNFNEIYRSQCNAISDIEKSHVIIANTVSGSGISFMENVTKYVAAPLTFNECKNALMELHVLENLDELDKIRQTYNYNNRDEYIFHNQVNNKVTLPVDKIKKCSSHLYNVKELDCKSAYGNALVEIDKELKDFPMFVFDCDLAIAVKTDGFRVRNPENFIQCGIQEHHAVSCAGALSKENCFTFYSSFAVFGLYEPYNQHNLNSLNSANLKTVLTHSGMVGEDGKTHHCNNYIGVAKTIFNQKLILPGDANQTDHIIRYIAKQYGNFCVCLGRSTTPIIYNEKGNVFYDENYSFEYGKADIIFPSKNFYIVSAGSVFGQAYEAVTEMRTEGVDIGLINVTAPLQIDVELIDVLASKGVYVVEDHNEKCGLYENLSAFLFQHNCNLQLEHVGLKNFNNSGSYEDLLVANRLDKCSIKSDVKNIISTGLKVALNEKL